MKLVLTLSMLLFLSACSEPKYAAGTTVRVHKGFYRGCIGTVVDFTRRVKGDSYELMDATCQVINYNSLITVDAQDLE